MKKIVLLVILLVGLIPLIDVLSLVIMTGENAIAHSSILQALGLQVRTEWVICLSIAISWFVPALQRTYGRAMQMIATWVYCMGVALEREGRERRHREQYEHHNQE